MNGKYNIYKIFKVSEFLRALVDIANIFYKTTLVPIAETIDAKSLEEILKLTLIKTLFISQGAIKSLLSCQ